MRRLGHGTRCASAMFALDANSHTDRYFLNWCLTTQRHFALAPKTHCQRKGKITDERVREQDRPALLRGMLGPPAF